MSSVLSSTQLEQQDTLIKVLQHRAKAFSNQVAFREKKLGIWHEATWADYSEKVEKIALGLGSLGLSNHQTAVMIGDNSSRQLCTELAIQSCGAAALVLYRDLDAEEILPVVEELDVSVAILEDEEQLDKVLSNEGLNARFTHLIYCNPKGMGKYNDDRLQSIDDLISLGAKVNSSDNLAATVSAEMPALITLDETLNRYTHKDLIALSLNDLKSSELANPNHSKTAHDDYVAILPLAWIDEQIQVVAHSLVTGMTVNFVEQVDTALSDLREIGPTYVTLSANIWSEIATSIQQKIAESSWFKRKCCELAIGSGANGSPSGLYNLLVLKPLRDKFGFKRLLAAHVAHEPLADEKLNFFLAIGVPLQQFTSEGQLRQTIAKDKNKSGSTEPNKNLDSGNMEKVCDGV